MAIHSSVLSWRIPWTEEPGRAIVPGVTRVTNTFTFHFIFLTFHFHSFERPHQSSQESLKLRGSLAVVLSWIKGAEALMSRTIGH